MPTRREAEHRDREAQAASLARLGTIGVFTRASASR
jgi:hypothetical protein